MKNLFLFLAVFLAIPASSLAFSDVPTNHRFSEEIKFVQEKNIVSGYTDGTFKPESTINRAEFTKIIISALYTKEEIENCDTSKFSFPDVPKNEWYAKFVCLAKKNGIINGYADGNFLPNGTITLPEAMKIVLSGYQMDMTSYQHCTEKTKNDYEDCNGKVGDEWYLSYFNYFSWRLHNSDKFKNFEYPLNEGTIISLDVLEYKISRGEMAYFIQKLENRKTMWSDANFQTISNANAGFSVQVPKKDEYGTITPLENYDAVKKEYFLTFKNSAWSEVVSLRFFSKKIEKTDLQSYFYDYFKESFPKDESWMMYDTIVGAYKTSENYAKQCSESITFNKDITGFYTDLPPFSQEGLEEIRFQKEYCTMWYTQPFYNTKSNMLIKISFGQEYPFSLGGEGFTLKNFQLK